MKDKKLNRSEFRGLTIRLNEIPFVDDLLSMMRRAWRILYTIYKIIDKQSWFALYLIYIVCINFSQKIYSPISDIIFVPYIALSMIRFGQIVCGVHAMLRVFFVSDSDLAKEEEKDTSKDIIMYDDRYVLNDILELDFIHIITSGGNHKSREKVIIGSAVTKQGGRIKEVFNLVEDDGIIFVQHFQGGSADEAAQLSDTMKNDIVLLIMAISLMSINIFCLHYFLIDHYIQNANEIYRCLVFSSFTILCVVFSCLLGRGMTRALLRTSSVHFIDQHQNNKGIHFDYSDDSDDSNYSNNADDDNNHGNEKMNQDCIMST